jgi:EmrB/QacA subfamily drug resistance transporter
MINSVKSPCDEAVIRSAPPCAKPQDVGIWVLVATILGSSMAFIDGSVVNVALPALQKELNASAAGVQWVVESYLLFLSALILVGGSLGDHFGRRRIFAIGTTLFVLASIWCGLSTTISQLIIARAIQGVGGALLVPGSLAIISASFDTERRGQAIGTWSGFTSVTSVIGPVLGGWLVEYASWRWVFFINVPLAIIVLVVTLWRVPESRDEGVNKKLDWLGALLVTIALAGIVYGLIESGTLGLEHPVVLLALAIGIVALLLFLLVEARLPHPMVPLTLFRSSTFSGANLLTFLLYGALSAATYFIPFNLIQVQGYSAAAVGASLTPFALTMFLLSRWTGGLVKRFGARLPLVIGPSITALGFILFAVPGIGGSYWTTFFPAVIVMSIGMTVTVAPLTTAVMSAVEQHYSGTASGINNAVSRTAGLIAIAVMGIVILHVFGNSLDHQLTLQDIPVAIRQAVEAQSGRLAGITIPQSINGPVRVLLKQAIDQSFVNGFRVVLLTCAALALASALAAGLMVEGKPTSPTSDLTPSVARLSGRAVPHVPPDRGRRPHQQRQRP